MLSNNNGDSPEYKNYVNKEDCIISSQDIAISCNQCRTALLVEYDHDSKELTAYELEDLTKDQKQTVHVHQCNTELANSVIRAVATNKRLIQDSDPGDFHYPPRREMN